MHTLDAAWMVDVASGAAPKAVQVLAACHAELNASASALLHQAEHVMGGFLEDTEPVAMSVGAFEALSLKLGGLPPAVTPRRRLSDQLNLDLPDTLKRVLSDHPHPILRLWKKTASMCAFSAFLLDAVSLNIPTRLKS